MPHIINHCSGPRLECQTEQLLQPPATRQLAAEYNSIRDVCKFRECVENTFVLALSHLSTNLIIDRLSGTSLKPNRPGAWNCSKYCERLSRIFVDTSKSYPLFSPSDEYNIIDTEHCKCFDCSSVWAGCVVRPGRPSTFELRCWVEV